MSKLQIYDIRIDIDEFCRMATAIYIGYYR